MTRSGQQCGVEPRHQRRVAVTLWCAQAGASKSHTVFRCAQSLGDHGRGIHTALRPSRPSLLSLDSTWISGQLRIEISLARCIHTERRALPKQLRLLPRGRGTRPRPTPATFSALHSARRRLLRRRPARPLLSRGNYGVGPTRDGSLEAPACAAKSAWLRGLDRTRAPWRM